MSTLLILAMANITSIVAALCATTFVTGITSMFYTGYAQKTYRKIKNFISAYIITSASDSVFETVVSTAESVVNKLSSGFEFVETPIKDLLRVPILVAPPNDELLAHGDLFRGKTQVKLDHEKFKHKLSYVEQGWIASAPIIYYGFPMEVAIYDCTPRKLADGTLITAEQMMSLASRMAGESSFLSIDTTGFTKVHLAVQTKADSVESKLATLRSAMKRVGLDPSRFRYVEFLSALMSFCSGAHINVTDDTSVLDLFFAIVEFFLPRNMLDMNRLPRPMAPTKFPLFLSLFSFLPPELEKTVLAAIAIALIDVSPMLFKSYINDLCTIGVCSFHLGGYTITKHYSTVKARCLAKFIHVAVAHKTEFIHEAQITHEDITRAVGPVNAARLTTIAGSNLSRLTKRLNQITNPNQQNAFINNIAQWFVRNPNDEMTMEDLEELQPHLWADRPLPSPSTSASGSTATSRSTSVHSTTAYYGPKYDRALKEAKAIYKHYTPNNTTAEVIAKIMFVADISKDHFSALFKMQRAKTLEMIRSFSEATSASEWVQRDPLVRAYREIRADRAQLRRFEQLRLIPLDAVSSTSEAGQNIVQYNMDAGTRGAEAIRPISNLLKPGQTATTLFNDFFTAINRSSIGKSHANEKSSRLGGASGGGRLTGGYSGEPIPADENLAANDYKHTHQDDEVDDDIDDTTFAQYTEYEEHNLQNESAVLYNFSQSLYHWESSARATFITEAVTRWAKAPNPIPEILNVSIETPQDCGTARGVPVLVTVRDGEKPRKFICVPADLFVPATDSSIKQAHKSFCKNYSAVTKAVLSSSAKVQNSKNRQPINMEWVLPPITSVYFHFVEVAGKVVGMILLPPPPIAMEAISTVIWPASHTAVPASAVKFDNADAHVVELSYSMGNFTHNLKTTSGDCGTPFLHDSRIIGIHVGILVTSNSREAVGLGICFPTTWGVISPIAPGTLVFQGNKIAKEACAAAPVISKNNDDDDNGNNSNNVVVSNEESNTNVVGCFDTETKIHNDNKDNRENGSAISRTFSQKLEEDKKMQKHQNKIIKSMNKYQDKYIQWAMKEVPGRSEDDIADDDLYLNKEFPNHVIEVDHMFSGSLASSDNEQSDDNDISPPPTKKIFSTIGDVFSDIGDKIYYNTLSALNLYYVNGKPTLLFSDNLSGLKPFSYPFKDVVINGPNEGYDFIPFQNANSKASAVANATVMAFMEEGRAVNKTPIDMSTVANVGAIMRITYKNVVDSYISFWKKYTDPTTNSPSPVLLRKFFNITKSGPPNFQTRQMIFLAAALKLARRTAAGYLYSTYGIPKPKDQQCNKRHFMSALIKDYKKLEAFIADCENLYSNYQSNQANTNMPISLYVKVEPVGVCKLNEGKSRTIKEPFFTASIVQLALTSLLDFDESNLQTLLGWHHDNLQNHGVLPLAVGVDFHTIDDIMAYGKFVDPALSYECKTYGSFVGNDLVKNLDSFVKSKEFNKDTLCFSLDVSGWDKTLPLPLIEALFRMLFGNANLGNNFAHAFNRDGTLNHNGCTARMKFVSWLSGNLATLTGNTMIHDAILKYIVSCIRSEFGQKMTVFSFAQGDDATIFIRTKNDITADIKTLLIATYANLGFKLKEIHCDKGKFDFCSLLCSKDGIKVDLSKMIIKMHAKNQFTIGALRTLANASTTEAWDDAARRAVGSAIGYNYVKALDAVFTLPPGDDSLKGLTLFLKEEEYEKASNLPFAVSLEHSYYNAISSEVADLLIKNLHRSSGLGNTVDQCALKNSSNLFGTATGNVDAVVAALDVTASNLPGVSFKSDTIMRRSDEHQEDMSMKTCDLNNLKPSATPAGLEEETDAA